jgi:hypothetical protein
MCPTEEIDLLITDSGASPEATAPFAAGGIEVRLV